MTSAKFPIKSTTVLGVLAKAGLLPHPLTFSDAAIKAKYDSLAGVETADGYQLQPYLGDAVGAAYDQGGARIQPFTRGFIVAHGRSAYVIYGETAAAWERLGLAVGLLGLPAGDTTASVNGGATSTFAGGVIAWSPTTGAHELHGAILAKWQQLGGPSWAYPASDESPVGTGDGRMNSFPGGAGIYWTGRTGPAEVIGAIAAKWNATGGPSGPLGFPTSGETGLGAGGRYSEFEHGVIVWHRDGPYQGTFVFTTLRFVCNQFSSTFDDIHVQVQVDAVNPSMSWHTWVPSEDDYASDPTPSDSQPLIIDAVRANTSITVWMDGLGEHTFGEDERLGIVEHTYDINNLWGAVGDEADHPANVNPSSDFTFVANYLFSADQPVDYSRPFRQNFMWPFRNFITGDLDQNDYAETYSDIAYDESTFWHPFDDHFYSDIYRHCAGTGNCFGVVLAALYAYVGQSEFGEPIYDNPTLQYSWNMQHGGRPDQTSLSDERFAHLANIYHGYYFGAPAMDWYSQLDDEGLTTNPARIFALSKALHDNGEQQILTFGTILGGQYDGHSVWPLQYEINDQGTYMRIYVANPNQPWYSSQDGTAAGNFIEITTGDNGISTWLINMGSDNWVGGSEVSQSEFFHTPFSKLNTRPTRWLYSILDAITNIGTVVTGPDTDVSVTDPGAPPTQTSVGANRGFDGVAGLVEIRRPGRVPLSQSLRVPVDPGRFVHPYAPGRLFRLRRPLDVPTVARGAELVSGRAPVLAHVVDSNPTLVWTLTPKPGATSTSIGLHSGRGSVIVECDGGAGHDVVTTEHTLQGLPSVTLTTAPGVRRAATVRLVGRVTPAVARTVTIEGIDLSHDTALEVALVDDAGAVAIHNPSAAPITCTLTISDAAHSLRRTGVPLANGIVTRIALINPAAALAGQQIQLAELATDGTVLSTRAV